MSTSTDIQLVPPHLQILRDRHPWIALCVVRVPMGYAGIIDSMLTSIEEVLGDQLPPAFFRVTEKKQQNSAGFRRRIEVFIEPRDDVAAQKNAIASIVGESISETSKACCRCGDELLTMHSGIRAEVDYDLSELSGGQDFCLECYKSDREKLEADFKKAHDEEFGSVYEEDDDDEDVGFFREIEEHSPAGSDSDNGSAEDEDEDYDDIPEDVAIMADPIPGEQGASVVWVEVYASANVDALDNLHKDAAGDAARRVRGVVRRLRESCPRKRLALIPDDWDNYCDTLACNFPNFAEVVEFIRNQLALSSVGNLALRLPPILLVGPPGVGKSEFLLTIASDLSTRLEIIDMSCAQTSSSLSGSEAYWGNSAPGMLFNTLTQGDVANPIFMLDEIDKAGGDSRFDPLATLHQLLEPRQAALFHDLSVPEVTVNTSYVIWVATANSIESISAPIRDRFVVFEVAEPTAEQMRVIIKNIYQRFISNHPSGSFFDNDISSDALCALELFHPRKVRAVLDGAFGFAARVRSSTLTAAHVQAGGQKEIHKKGIGFLATIEK